MTGGSGKGRGQSKVDQLAFSSSYINVRNSGTLTQKVTTDDDTELKTSEIGKDFKVWFYYKDVTNMELDMFNMI